jgi:hypothetical protein
MHSNNSSNKKVRFSTWVSVFPNPYFIEIPTKKYLWWSESDKNDAQLTMIFEIRNLQKTHPSITVKQAMKLLYQPNNIIYDEKKKFEI